MSKSNLNQSALYKRADDIRKKAIAEAQAEYERTIETIDRLMGTPRLEFNSGEPELPEIVSVSWLGLKRAIAGFVEKSTDTFTAGDVFEYLKKTYPTQKLILEASALNCGQWRTTRKFNVFIVGRGRDPSKYKK